jgi:ATPase subunit of ABC transporter with duplicated ATPase domains
MYHESSFKEAWRFQIGFSPCPLCPLLLLNSQDEPTNNLDLESVAALVESVQKFEGAVICVSHDQYFVQSVAKEAWVVNNSKVTQVSSFEDYRASQFKLLAKETTS